MALAWLLNLGFAAGGAPSPTPTPSPAPPEAYSGGYLNMFELARIRRDERRRRERQRRQDEDEIQQQLDREVAELLYEQEAKDAERADLERLQALADRLMRERTELPRPVLAVAIKAHEERTRNSLLHLERLIAQMLEEEEALVLALLLVD